MIAQAEIRAHLIVDYMPLARACLCINCEVVFPSPPTSDDKPECPRCRSTNYMPLATWLGSAGHAAR